MLRIIFILLISLMSLACLAQQKARIGMSVEEVMKIYPGMIKVHVGDETTLTRKEDVYGLSDEWGYRFENEKLNWIHFDKYMDSITEKNFNKCLRTTQKIIKAYTKAYGKPDSTLRGNTRFIDPYKKHHWGYDVLEARWKNYAGMKISVEFTFMGGKGEYHFLVKINYFDKDYPYYD